MNLNWQSAGYVAPGGPVLGFAGDSPDRAWLASPAGLFTRFEGEWSAVRRGISFWRINGVLARRKTVWLAGMPHGILRSTNEGRSWHHCWIDQTEAPVLTIAASPNYGRDRVLLAGTDGDGILRSTDGGRHWELSNFGLRDFAILDLATAPSWGRYEYAFAVTESGLYQSPNGGRAWRQLDLGQSDLAPLCIALTPTFEHDQTLFAGTQDGGLFVSQDAGHQWRLAAEGLEPVNALQVTSQGTLLVGTGETIVRQPAAAAASGFNAEDSCSLPEAILCLSESPEYVYAGLADGLYRSADDGQSWRPVAGLSARRFVWFLPVSGHAWLAAGPEEGVYLSSGGVESWQPIWHGAPLLAVAADGGQIAISSPEGLAISSDEGQSWEELFRPDTPVTALASQGPQFWAGSQSGEIWRFDSAGQAVVDAPFAGQPILALSSHSGTLVAATWSAESNMMQLWRSIDGGARWQLWFSQSSAPTIPQLAFRDKSGLEAFVGLGTYLYRQVGDEWQRHRLTNKDAPITALWASNELIVAALTDHLVYSVDGQNWTACDDDSQGQPVVAIHSDPAQPAALLACTSHGQILRSY